MLWGNWQKSSLIFLESQVYCSLFKIFWRPTNQPTDRPTDRQTDKVTYRVACTRLKSLTISCYFVIISSKPSDFPFNSMQFAVTKREGGRLSGALLTQNTVISNLLTRKHSNFLAFPFTNLPDTVLKMLKDTKKHMRDQHTNRPTNRPQWIIVSVARN